ncbi:hypothetical protein [Nonomuraea sp. B5E05]
MQALLTAPDSAAGVRLGETRERADRHDIDTLARRLRAADAPRRMTVTLR